MGFCEKKKLQGYKWGYNCYRVCLEEKMINYGICQKPEIVWGKKGVSTMCRHQYIFSVSFTTEKSP